MQQVTFCLGINQSLIPVYHPASNPEERKKRDLKVQISILVENDHTNRVYVSLWRFAMTFRSEQCRECWYRRFAGLLELRLRTPDTNWYNKVHQEICTVVENENFIPEITPFLCWHIDCLLLVKETNEYQQDSSKRFADKQLRQPKSYQPGDKILVETHKLSKSSVSFTSKFVQRRDGPSIVLEQNSSTSYELPAVDRSTICIGKYHVSALQPSN